MTVSLRRLILATALGATLWFASGLAAFWVVSTSSRFAIAVELIVPPTSDPGAWLRESPWNLLVPALGAVLFASVLAFGLAALRLATARRPAPGWARVFAAWLVAVLAAAATAAVWALGSTIVTVMPTGWLWAFREAQPQLLASALFGVVWGWAPALVVGLRRARTAAPDFERDLDAAAGSQMVPRGTVTAAAVPSALSDPDGAQSDQRRPDAHHDTPTTNPVAKAAGWWPLWLSAATTVILSVALVVAQPAAAGAGSVLWAGSPDRLPHAPVTATPTPTPVPPARVSSTPVTPAADWCSPEEMLLTVSSTQAAVGHRGVLLQLTNTSAAPCVMNGYPDVAFSDETGGSVEVVVAHGASYLAADPGSAPQSVQPGGSVVSFVGWNATGATDGAATRIWAAAYAGAERERLPIDSDLVKDSAVHVTAWAPPPAE